MLNDLYLLLFFTDAKLTEINRCFLRHIGGIYTFAALYNDNR